MGLTLPKPESLVIEEEKRPVLDNRAAECAAKLVATQFVPLNGEEVLGVEDVVAEKLVNTAVELIGPALSDDIDN